MTESQYIIKAETPAYGGYVIGRDGKIVFIRGAIPGELVDVSVEEKKKDYVIASVRNIVESSPFRRTPPCGLFGTCGGCQLQFIDYERQVSLKEEILLDAMRRIGDMDVSLLPSMTGKEFGYRRRGQFKVSKNGEAGFYREGSREVVPVDSCPIMCGEINEILLLLKSASLKAAREIHIISGDTSDLLIKGELSDEDAQKLMDGGVSGIAFENGDSLGKDYITLDLNGLKYSVAAWSFFQSHWSLNIKVVETLVGGLGHLEDKRILDLYAGAGNFSLPLSQKGGEVVAVEENPYAVEDGRRNAALNGIKNCDFIHMSVEKSLPGKNKQGMKLFGEKFDIIVMDPPRPGLTSDCMKKILEAGSERIVYVSCNPATLARDIKKMLERYKLESLRMIDFFPNTYHIEAMAFLKLK